MRKLNRKLFFILLGSCAALTAGTCLAHYLQTGRIARALLWHADRSEQDGRPDQAVKYLGRYLEFEPDDTEQRARLGRLLAGEHFAASPRSRERAFFVLEQVLSREPDRHDIRLLLARLAMDLRRAEVAKTHLDALVQARPADGEVHRLLAQWHETHKAHAEARDAYLQAVRHAPDRVENYVRLARLLRGPLKDPQRADAVMEDLVKANERSAPAHLARGRYHKEQSKLEAAAADLDRARQLAPDDADVLLASADLAREQGQFDQGRAYLRRGFELYPRDARLFQTLANLEVKAKRPAEAVASLQRGAEALTGHARLELLWDRGNLLVQEAAWDEAQKTVARMKELKAPAPGVDYLQARIHLGARRWSEAARLLEGARPALESLADEPRALLVLIDLHLGQCYEQLNEPTRQLAAFARAAERDPASVPARLGMAAAQQALGRLDDALAQYKQLGQQPDAAGRGWLETARLLIRRNLQRDERDRDWREVHDALARARKAEPNNVEVVLLLAQVLVEQREPDRARDLLTQARDADPKQAEFWAALADLAGLRGEADKVPALLDEAEKKCGDGAALRLARARSWVERKTPESAAAVAKLAEGVDRFNADDQSRLLLGLGEAAFRLGRNADAARLWDRLAQQPRHQNDLRLRLLLFELALKAGDEPAMNELLGQVKRIESGQETLWRYGEALRLTWRARRGDRSGLDPARTLLEQVALQRPAWPAAFVARAEVEALRGTNPGQAVTHYRRALELGERSPRVVRLLVQQLRQLQRYDEAEEELRKLPRQLQLSGDLQRLAADLSLRNQDPARAVELAGAAVESDSTDYQDHLWLGQLLAVSGRQPREAEQALRRAAELAPQVPEVWVTLVQFLHGAGLKTEEVIEQARAKLPAEQAPLALAQCYEVTGKSDRAREHYQAAAAKRPDDPVVLRAVAGFALRAGRHADAEAALRPILDGKVKASKEDVSWARRTLALVLAVADGGRRFPEALALVGLGLDADGQLTETAPPADDERAELLRTRAHVLATQRHRAVRAKAVVLLEELKRGQALTAADQYLLAQLYDGEGPAAWPKARELFRDLLNAQGKNPVYLAYFAQALLRRREVEEAQPCIGRLEQVEKARGAKPGAFGTVELKALALELRGEGDKAVTLLRAHVERPDARPEEVLLLIGLLGRQKRVQEALDACERAWKTCPPESVGVACLAVLRAGQPEPKHGERVEGWLKAALDKDPKATALLLNLADLEDLRGRYDQAEEVYKRVLAQDARNVVALNNLAWLLAQRPGKGDEALALINRAIALLGPRPELLDTRAVVYLAQRRSDLALKDLAQVTQETPTGPRYFHLARAHQMANNRDEAARAFRKARDLGLQRTQLHPAEQVAWGEVAGRLDQR